MRNSGNAKSGCCRAALAGLAVLLLASCDSSDYMAGIDGSGARIFAQGPIEAFGSIVLSGMHYDVSQAEIRINGDIATEADLAIGQVVTIRAVTDAEGGSKAESVEFEADLLGPLASFDPVSGVLIVLEQEIRIGASTVLDLGPAENLAALAAGDPVEISGFRGAGNVFHASYIRLADPSDELRILGPVANVDTAAHRFTIGALVVDYASAGLIEGFPGGEPGDGDRVLAEGAALNADGSLAATRLKYFEPETTNREGEEAEVEGLITRFESVTDFDVAGTRATTTPQTVYEGGSSADLAPNARIQIEGRFDANGVIVASKIEVKDL